MRFLRIRLFADEDNFGMTDWPGSSSVPAPFGVSPAGGLGVVWIGTSSFFGCSDDETDGEADEDELLELDGELALEELRMFTSSVLEDSSDPDELSAFWSCCANAGLVRCACSILPSRLGPLRTTSKVSPSLMISAASELGILAPLSSNSNGDVHFKSSSTYCSKSRTNSTSGAKTQISRYPSLFNDFFWDSRIRFLPTMKL
mmetsp:Transcript_28056/g.110317  ORF Transcript_28056/g.110317 Transcript_28056/m.110317 type:complete len:202 (+) Transcript_28056:3125-3730(+)